MQNFRFMSSHFPFGLVDSSQTGLCYSSVFITTLEVSLSFHTCFKSIKTQKQTIKAENPVTFFIQKMGIENANSKIRSNVIYFYLKFSIQSNRLTF
jgi:hypothetical protein